MPRIHLLGLCFILSTPALAQTGAVTTTSTTQTPLPAKTVIDQATKVAKVSNKVVFVHVGASWCGWCHKLDQMLSSKEVGPIMAAHYVIVPLVGLEQGSNKVLENPGVDSVMQALGLSGGPPMFAFLDANGRKIASSFVLPPDNGNIGYPGTPEELKAFDTLLEKTAPSMSATDRTSVIAYLKKNASD